jgi:hypothetical protein
MSHLKIQNSRQGSRLRQILTASSLAVAASAGFLISTATGASAQQKVPPFGPSVNTQNKNIFYFMPYGQQLDNDTTLTNHVPDTSLPTYINQNIYDITIQPNTPLDIDLYLYTLAPQYRATPSPSTLTSFIFLAEFDSSEYKFESFVPAASVNTCPVVPNVGYMFGGLECNFNAGFNVSNNPSFANAVKLGTFKGMSVIPGTSPDDGQEDFKLTLKDLVYTGSTKVSVANVVNQFQDVELQKVPAPLSILGVASVFGTLGKARKFSRHLKTFS